MTGNDNDGFGLNDITQTMEVPDLTVHGDKDLPAHFRVDLDRLDGDRIAETITLTKVRTVIGRREGDAALGFDDPLLSRKHAAIEVLGSAFIQIWDLASKNGTYVNEARITTVRRIVAGDVVRMGTTRLRLVVDLEP